MEDPISFYTKQISLHQEELAKVKKQLLVYSVLRILVFLLAILGVYFVFASVKMLLGVVLITAVLFVFLVSKYTDLQYRRNKMLALLKINETEIEVLKRNFHELPTGEEFKDPKHSFSQDIDLFGRGSFYQYVNRTSLVQGSRVFAKLLTANSVNGIIEKQQAIAELSKMPEWRQEFSAIATLVQAETPTHVIVKWFKTYSCFVPKIMGWLPFVFSGISITLFTVYFLDGISGWILFYWFLLGLGITGGFLARINKLSEATGKVQSTFRQYQRLILEIEQQGFSAQLLKEEQGQILSGTEKSSTVLKQFSDILGALDQRNNMLFGFLGNGFLLWDLVQSYRIEKWILKNGTKVEQWFDTIAFFDAYNSLGNFGFNHPTYSFPILSKESTVLKAKDAGHPLLDPAQGVLNDVHIDKENFLIITGANMAGKSTFLRTVSLQIVMANMGLPVHASVMEYSPIKLITSMRTSDSLTDDESYFFSELKRLKFIVDEIEKDNYFIVLDEILKGTNSTDKAIGSKKFVEKLVVSKSTGIIATHDLSLCEVAKQIPQVENYFFDAEIIDDELHFDYKFKKGICKNMNASFLLKKMEIV
ncbi:MutS-related protein [Spongiimicrobium sp. 3-5]|uniref:MutS-related protein n=1 Tax=Spongiimicrobium sp. 3-5 TaxID=3332596 RepID=UPI0039814AE0